MAKIDNLEIQITTSAAQAASELERLGTALESIKGSSSYPNSLKTYAKNLTLLADSLGNISSTNLAKLSVLADALKGLDGIKNVNISPALSRNVATLASTVSKISTADIAKLERLSNAIGKLGSLQSGTGNKLSLKFSGLSNVGNSLTKINSGLKTSTTLTQNFRAQTDILGKSWSAVAGFITGALVTLRRVAPTLKEWINQSNQYIENLNKFNVVMGEFAESEFEYAQRVNEVMGIDPAQWIQYESTFQTLGTGFGVASDRAAIMSRQLTQLGYDIASFNNISIEDSMQRVQSAFAGELEPVRRLGYDLSQTRLQSYATELGITTLVSSMDQASKSQLRYYALMTQVTEAQHDMAITLNAPANQLRILQNNLTQASRAIGNIFIPILNKIIPYAIAAAKAIRTLADTIAALFGFEIPEFDNSIRGLSSGADAAQDIASGLGSGAKASEKMKDNLQKFDELNVLKSPNEGGGGGSGLADTLAGLDFDLPTYDFLEGAVQSNIDGIYQKLMDFFKLDGLDAEDFGRSLADKFNKAIAKIPTYDIGATLGKKFNTILDFAYGYSEGYDGFSTGAIGAQFLNGIVAEFDGAKLGRTVSSVIQSGLDTLDGFLTTLDWEGIGYDVGRFINSIDWIGILSKTLTIGTKIVSGIFSTIRGAITGLGSSDGGSTASLDRVYASAPAAIAQRVENSMKSEDNFGTNLVSAMADSVNHANPRALLDAIFTLITTVIAEALGLFWEIGAKTGDEIAEGIWEALHNGNRPTNAIGGTVFDLVDQSTNSTPRDPMSQIADTVYDAGYNAIDNATGDNWALNRTAHTLYPLVSLLANPVGTIDAAIGEIHDNESNGHSATTGGQVRGSWLANYYNALEPIGAGGITGMIYAGVRHDSDSSKNAILDNNDRIIKSTNRTASTYSKAQLSTINKVSAAYTKSGTTIVKSFDLQKRTINDVTSNLNSNVDKQISGLDKLSYKFSVDTVNKFGEGKNAISATVSQLSTDTSTKFDYMSTKIYSSIDNTSKAITTPLTSIKDQITTAYKDAGDESVKAIGDMGDKMSGALGKVVNESKDSVENYKGIWDGLHNTVKATSNSVIAGAESMGNGVTTAFNQVIRNLKNFKVTIPNIGDNKDAGKQFNFDHLHELDKIAIPRLAKGGVTKHSMFANIGEAGREAVIPLDNTTSWADTFIAKTQEATAPALAEQNALLRQEVEYLRQIAAKEFSVTSRDVYSAVRSENDSEVKRTGYNPLAI